MQVRQDLVNYVAVEENTVRKTLTEYKNQDFIQGALYVIKELKKHFAIDKEELKKVNLDKELERLVFNEYAEKYENKKQLYKECGETL